MTSHAGFSWLPVPSLHRHVISEWLNVQFLKTPRLGACRRPGLCVVARLVARCAAAQAGGGSEPARLTPRSGKPSRGTGQACGLCGAGCWDAAVTGAGPGGQQGHRAGRRQTTSREPGDPAWLALEGVPLTPHLPSEGATPRLRWASALCRCSPCPVSFTPSPCLYPPCPATSREARGHAWAV